MGFFIIRRMGAHLSSPRTDKTSAFGGDLAKDSTQFGCTSMQGWRVSMEDAHLAIPDFIKHKNGSIGLYGVFDGHGGHYVSTWCSKHFHDLFRDELQAHPDMPIDINVEPRMPVEKCVAESLQSAFLRVDEELLKPEIEAELKSYYKPVDKAEVPGTCMDSSDILKVLLPNKRSTREALKILEAIKNPEGLDQQCRSIPIESEDVTMDAVGGEEERAHYASMIQEVCVDSGNYGREGVSEFSFEYAKGDMSAYSDELDDISPEDSIDAIMEEPYGEAIAHGCGAASVVLAVTPGPNPCLVAANAGDSRVILCRAGKAIPLSHDHKPGLPEESERIRRAGGSVTNGRVDGNLNLSRAIGDLSFKQDHTLKPEEQRISAFPDVRICPISKEDDFVILACDGIWDCKTNQEVVDFVRERINSAKEKNAYDGSTLSKICEELCDACVSKNPSESEGIGCDNMTVIIVKLGDSILDNKNVDHTVTMYRRPLGSL